MYYIESKTVFDMPGFKNRSQKGILSLKDNTKENDTMCLFMSIAELNFSNTKKANVSCKFIFSHKNV